jgi:hypothetical protein
MSVCSDKPFGSGQKHKNTLEKALMFTISVDHDEKNETYIGTLVDEDTKEIIVERKHPRPKILLKQLGWHLRQIYKDLGEALT